MLAILGITPENDTSIGYSGLNSLVFSHTVAEEDEDEAEDDD